jgi:hypothetical protein
MGISFRSQKTSVEPISYVCDNCGASVTANDEVPRCLGCGKNLCEICNNYMLCPQDYHILNKKHKRKVKRETSKLENLRRFNPLLILIPMLVIPLFFIMIIFLVQETIVTILLSVMGGFCWIFGVIFFFFMKKMVVTEEERIKTSIRGILFKYDIKKFNHAKNEEFDSDRKIKSVICSYCGSESKGISIKYCEACGKEL